MKEKHIQNNLRILFCHFQVEFWKLEIPENLQASTENVTTNIDSYARW